MAHIDSVVLLNCKEALSSGVCKQIDELKIILVIAMSWTPTEVEHVSSYMWDLEERMT